MKSVLETLPRTRADLVPATHVDADALATALRADIRGEVRFDAGDRALWATDAANYRQIPIGVVLPRDADDVVRTVEIARRHRAPILPRGGGTSLAGQCCNVAVVLDFSKYAHRVLEVDPGRRRARVEPGTILDELRSATEIHGLTFGPDPATHDRCTLGGMIGNNSCGTHSVMAEFYGPGPRTEDSVEELEVLTYDGIRMRVGATSEEELDRIIRAGGRTGEIYARLRGLRDRYADQIRERFPPIPRRVAGYNLPALLPENGFNVARALVGSEGTCATVLEATVTLMPSPRARSLVVLGYPTPYDAGDHVPELREFRPIALEAFDERLVSYMRKKGLHPADIALLPDGGGWLLVEFGGDNADQARARARETMASLKQRSDAPTMRLYDDAATQRRLWNVRESALGATAFVPGEADAWPGWEDSAVPVDCVGDYLRDLRALLDKYNYHCSIYGHFGQGCFHTRIDFDLTTEDGIEKYRAFTRDAAELVSHKYGGSISGEHGDGQARGDLLPIMFGEEVMEAFREFKAIWDPDHLMNPGKLVDAYPRDSNLRLGSDYRPATPETHFQFPQDDGAFAHATLRCVGVGACRRLGGGTMCPSYMVLREEKHSTRGRAHLLFEMLQGDVVTDGWKSEEVKESLDLCLACKGCKGDCPVQVDVATYKAEFLSHYYDGRPRPASAYAFGLIDRWARLAALAPGLVNFATGAPGLRTLAKAAVGIAPERYVPRFAPRTFKAWWKERVAASGPADDQAVFLGGPTGSRTARGQPTTAQAGDRPVAWGTPTRSAVPSGQPTTGQARGRFAGNGDSDTSEQSAFGRSLAGDAGKAGHTAPGSGTRVLLWPDTFNNHFHPQTLAAAAEVLEAAGCDIVVPEPPLCCGRPLYDFGMLDTAKRQLRRIIDVLRPEIEAGTPLIGLEPSCVAVFRDELVDLFPDDREATRLAEQTRTLGEFLVEEGKHENLPDLAQKAVVHGHCHHKAVLSFSDDEEVLRRLGLELDVLDSGCCGMAGSFGFEKEKYDVSIAAGERVLLPAVRAADPNTLIIADGFSCREQIAQTTHRRALHLAEVVQIALHSGEPGAAGNGGPPEAQHARLAPAELVEATSALPSVAALAALGLAAVASGALAWRWARKP